MFALLRRAVSMGRRASHLPPAIYEPQSDFFNKADSNVSMGSTNQGRIWLGIDSAGNSVTWGITGNQAYSVSGAGRALCNAGSHHNISVFVQADITYDTSAPGIFLSSNNLGSYQIGAQIVPGGFKVYSMNDNVYGSFGPGEVAFSPVVGTVYTVRLEISVSHILRLFVNGVQYGSSYQLTPTEIARYRTTSNTYVGIRTDAASAARWDNFSTGRTPEIPSRLSGIPGLSLMFRASDLALPDNTPVASWPSVNDPSGTRAIQPDTTRLPLYRTNGIGGKPALQFDGVDDHFKAYGKALTYTNNVPGITTFVVLRNESSPSTSRAVMGISVGTGTNQRASMSTSSSNSGAWRIGGRRLDSDAFDSTVTPFVAQTTDLSLTMSYNYSGTKATVWTNGTLAVNDSSFLTAGNTSATNSAHFTIGATPGIGDFWQGAIAEIISFNRTLTNEERAQVHSYIEDSYGIAVEDYTANEPSTTSMGNFTQKSYTSTTQITLVPDDATAAFANGDALRSALAGATGPAPLFTVAPGHYYIGGIDGRDNNVQLIFDVPGVTLKGMGVAPHNTIFESIDELQATWRVQADGINLFNFTHKVNATGRSSLGESGQGNIWIRSTATNFVAQDVVADGSRDATWMFLSATGWKLNRCTSNNSRSDAFHIADNANNGQMYDCRVYDSGDDMIGLVSYGAPEAQGVRDITIVRFQGERQTHGRGIGMIHCKNINVYGPTLIADTSAAGIIFAREPQIVGAGQTAGSTSNINVYGEMRFRRANTIQKNGESHGAIHFYNPDSTYAVSDITFHGPVIMVDTQAGKALNYQVRAVSTNGGSVTASIANASFYGISPADKISTSLAAGSITTVGWDNTTPVTAGPEPEFPLP